MSSMSLTEKLTYSTVLIQCQYRDGTQGSGTGFIINLCQDQASNQCVPVIVTNKHVIKNSNLTQFEFCKCNKDGTPNDRETVLSICPNQYWIMHPSPNVDLCCLPLVPVINNARSNGEEIFYIPIGTELIPPQNEIEDLSAMEDVVMIGYPIGLSDRYNHKPIMRKGVTATHIKKDYQGEKTFLVDMACFPGSSGSPIFILNQGAYTTPEGLRAGNRIYFVGILYAGPQYSASGVLQFASLPNLPRPLTQIPTNLGIAIKSSELYAFEQMFKNAN